MYERSVISNVYSRCKSPRLFIQILTGPRQIGKTTLITQLASKFEGYFQYASADDPLHQNRNWLESQWKQARSMISSENDSRQSGIILAIDEIQKIPKWPDIVKTLWDEDSRNKTNLKIILLGSSSVKITQGSSESLAGRFEIIPIFQWSRKEMFEAFDFDLQQYAYFGGYPGAAQLASDIPRWKKYIKNSIIDTVINTDILSLHRVDKPALLKQLFYLSCEYSGQILSLNKALGQLQDSGNTSTISFYLDLLSSAGLVRGLQKWSPHKIKTRASSPKLNVMDVGLMTAVLDYSPEMLSHDPNLYGRVIESLVGTHLLHCAPEEDFEVFYWNDGKNEVDFIVQKGQKILAIEVKSGRKSRSFGGMNAFLNKYPDAKPLLVGAEGIDLDRFLSGSIQRWL
jgi:predicted AAA+ superfamily ATPase